MWSGSDEMLKDFEIVSEIYEKDQIQNKEKIFGNSNAQPRLERQKPRIRLYSESDEDEENEPTEKFEDDNDPLKVMCEIQQQIAQVTGNVHDNSALSEYWRKSVIKKPPPEQGDLKTNESSLVFKSTINVDKLNPKNADTICEKPKIVTKQRRKGTIADAISNSIKLKEADSNLKEADSNLNAASKIIPPKKEIIYNLPPSTNIIKTRTIEPNCRISLPIRNNCYKDFYTGTTIAHFQQPESDDELTHKWNVLDDFDRYSSSSRSSSSSRYDNKTYYPVENPTSVLDLKSDLQFPPLK